MFFYNYKDNYEVWAQTDKLVYASNQHFMRPKFYPNPENSVRTPRYQLFKLKHF